LLRPGGEPRLPRGGQGPGRRGARERRRGGRGAGRLGSRVRGDRAGEAEGVRPARRALPGLRPGVMEGDPERPLQAARESGLLDVAHRMGAEVSALHVNYGLREGAEEDEVFCRELCDRLEVPLVVERVELAGDGNLQDQAREARYALAEHHAAEDYAAAHTAT